MGHGSELRQEGRDGFFAASSIINIQYSIARVQQTVVDKVLSMDEVVEEGDLGEIFDDAFVGDHGRVEFIAELIEDEADAGEAFGADRVQSEQDVIERSELVGRHQQHWQAEAGGQVRHPQIAGHGHLPAARAFHHYGVVAGGEVPVVPDQGLLPDRAVL